MDSSIFNRCNKCFKKIPDFITNNFDYNESKDNVFQLAAYHHKPSSELQALISIADWWSAGIDRRQSLEKILTILPITTR